jgi:hypothetical protein
MDDFLLDRHILDAKLHVEVVWYVGCIGGLIHFGKPSLITPSPLSRNLDARGAASMAGKDGSCQPYPRTHGGCWFLDFRIHESCLWEA